MWESLLTEILPPRPDGIKPHVPIEPHAPVEPQRPPPPNDHSAKQVDARSLIALLDSKSAAGLRQVGCTPTVEELSDIVIELLSHGRNIAIVSSGHDALAALPVALEQRGLGDLMCNQNDLSGQSDELQRVLLLGSPNVEEALRKFPEHQLRDDRSQLISQLSTFLSTVVGETDMTRYELIGKLVALREVVPAEKCIELPLEIAWSPGKIDDLVLSCREYLSSTESTRPTETHPFYGMRRDPDSCLGAEEVSALGLRLGGLISELANRANVLCRDLGLPPPGSLFELSRTLRALEVITDFHTDNGRLFENFVKSATAWHEPEFSALHSAIEHRINLSRALQTLGSPVDLEALAGADLEKLAVTCGIHHTRSFWGKLIDAPYFLARYCLESISTAPKSAEAERAMIDSLKQIQHLKELVDVEQTVTLNNDQRALLQGDLSNPDEWYSKFQLAVAFNRYAEATDAHPCEAALDALLHAPDDVYAREREIKKLAQLCESTGGELTHSLERLGVNPTSQHEQYQTADLYDLGKRFSIWQASPEKLEEAVAFERVEQNREQLHTADVCARLQRCSVEPDQIDAVVRRAWLERLYEREQAAIPALDSIELNDAIRREFERGRNKEAHTVAKLLETSWRSVPAEYRRQALLKPTQMETGATITAKALKPIFVGGSVAEVPRHASRGSPWVVLSVDSIDGSEAPSSVGSVLTVGGLGPRVRLSDAPRASREAITSILDPVLRKTALAFDRMGFDVATAFRDQQRFLDLLIFERNGDYPLCGVRVHPKHLSASRAPAPLHTADGSLLPIVSVQPTDLLDRGFAPSQFVAKLIDAVHAQESAAAPIEIPRQNLVTMDDLKAQPYKVASFTLSASEKVMLTSGIAIADSILSGVLNRIVEIESPIRPDELVTRMRHLAGVERFSERVRDEVERLVRLLPLKGCCELRGKYLYANRQMEIVPRERSLLRGPLHTFSNIPPEEIDGAVYRVVIKEGSLSADKVVSEVPPFLGFRTIPEEARAIIQNSLQRLTREGRLALSQGLYREPRTTVR